MTKVQEREDRKFPRFSEGSCLLPISFPGVVLRGGGGLKRVLEQKSIIPPSPGSGVFPLFAFEILEVRYDNSRFFDFNRVFLRGWVN